MSIHQGVHDEPQRVKSGWIEAAVDYSRILVICCDSQCVSIFDSKFLSYFFFSLFGLHTPLEIGQRARFGMQL